ncbi:RIMS-binding protein 2-like [Sinocyclocheilus anshuiensis]|uniref:RIMS-binding protein 2-like n=1 Tax=Sinocyclocheilus anshuiensis TaxID=1608454 RepID=UPI0007B91DCD|nr:PREDICTED: RIMS-binding protein 2-like [Sinocyclocheilus anshuiensis]
MREAADRRQQLEAEHEQALAFLNSRQQEINLLQKVQAEAEKEREEVVHLLESHMDKMQVKVHDLEQKCRTQSEQCNILSKELERYHLGSDAEETLNTDSQEKNSYNSLQREAEKSDERSDGSPLVSELPIVQQHKRDKPEELSVKPTVQTQSRSSSPMQASLSEMENEVSPAPRSKTRYTGQVRLGTVRYSYNPYDGPNEHPEAELPLVAGKYLYVYGDMDDDGFYEGELLDGQRGLVPSNFVEFVQDKEKSSIKGGEEQGRLEQSCLSLMTIDGGAHLDSLRSDALGHCTNGTGALDGEELGDDIVPYPRKINLIKQLARSVIVAWEAPLVPLGWGNINGYNILVDGEVRSSVPFGSRTKLLLEKLDLASCTYRVSVQSMTDRGLSDELRCTLLVGRNVVVAPTGLRMDDILRDSAELSWLPSNSNYGHVVYLDGVEHAVVRPCSYKLRFVNLKAATVYKVKVLAKPHQVPWHMPLEQREKREAGVEFCTQAAGPPLPPQEVQVQCGHAPGVLQVRWKPPPMTTTGTSNGANVIGYAVCTKGQRIAEVMYPLADYVAVELNRLQCLEAHEVIVRTLSAQGESQDSHAAVIPNHLLVPLPKTLPPSHHMPQQSQPMPPHPQIRTLPPHPGPQPPTHLQPLPIERRSQGFHSQNSDEEEDEESYQARRRGASMDDFLRGSELGRQSHYSHSEEYHTESSRGSDLSDIMEEDEEELYSEMQHEEGRRRNSHNAPKTGASAPSSSQLDRESYRKPSHREPQPQRRPLTVPSIGQCMLSQPSEITTESNSEGNLSPVKEDVYYGSVARHRTWSSRRHGGHRPPYDGYRDQSRRSPPYYDESEQEDPFRVFVALFDYDPLSMSPNPDAADEELPFKEGQIIKVYGDKDNDGFYRGEIRGRSGLIPCNMVSEIRAEDDETMEQLMKQGFLPLNTPVDRIEQNRRGRHPVATRRMVALYDYDPRESSPNVDVEAELTFCAGDIVAVFGDIDEDGFYYGELNGHRGLVPSNFLEEVPDDVEVYLTDTPSHHGQDKPNPVLAPRPETKRVPVESTVPAPAPGRPASPTVRPMLPVGPVRPLSPARGPRDLASKKKKGLLSKGKKLLKKFSK